MAGTNLTMSNRIVQPIEVHHRLYGDYRDRGVLDVFDVQDKELNPGPSLSHYFGVGEDAIRGHRQRPSYELAKAAD